MKFCGVEYMQDLSFPALVGQMASKGRPFVVATVVDTEGSTLAKRGFKVVMNERGEVVYGTLGGACPEGAISEVALETIRTRKPKLVKVILEDTGRAVAAALKPQESDVIHVETNCGGRMQIFVEPFTEKERLIIVSDGGRDEVASAVAAMAETVGFRVELVDPSGTVPEIRNIHKSESILELDVGKEDYVVLVTRGRLDVPVLEELSKVGCKYIGLMGSRTRIAEDFEKLRAKGVADDYLNFVRAPVGADIGAQTPEEIALSIVAELVAARHGKEVWRKR